MEPMLVGETSRWRSYLNDQALELVAASARLDRSLPKGVAGGLAHLVRSMNCYYSNLIEGHDTHPVDIERALRADYSNEPRKRDLQLEARSHIAVQAWIDAGGLAGRAATTTGVREIHRRFCEQLPAPLLWVENPDAGTRQQVVPGLWRVSDMKQLVQPEAFVGRVVRWANAEVAAGRLVSRSDRLLESLLGRGEVDRGDVERLLDVSDRTARRVTSGLVARGVVVSDSPRAPLRLGFPATVPHEWLPGLFPEPPVA